MPKNSINISKKAGYRIALKTPWIRAVEESIIKLLKLEYPVDLGIFITDDSEIQELNKSHRNLDKPTDVLSFYMQDQKARGKDVFIAPPDDIVHLGEIVISFETVRRDAKTQRITLEEELTFLLIHGTLHLLGYDHELAEEEKLMRKKEGEIFRALAAK